MVVDDGQYAKGVDSRKGGLGRRFSAVDAPAFPYAFCNIYIDRERGIAYTQKGDGVGSKTTQRYLYWRETGDASVFEGEADDCFEMNAGDVSCAGLLHRWRFSDNIAVNQLYVNKEAYADAVNRRLGRLKEVYASRGLPWVFTGGETADLVDQTKTVIFDGTIDAETPLDKAVTCEKIAPGDVIVGIRSGGPCNLEVVMNSGMMSNGVTAARHVLMHPEYADKYPEIADPRGDKYTGKYHIDDNPAGLGMTVSQAIMSPTRHYSIMIKRMLEAFGPEIHGIVMNTGGGQSKCTRVGRPGIRYVKDKLPEPDPIFQLIQQESGMLWDKMFKSFNMGVGLDVMMPRSTADSLIKMVSYEFGVGCQETGHCEASDNEKNSVLITGKYGEFEIPAE